MLSGSEASIFKEMLSTPDRFFATAQNDKDYLRLAKAWLMAFIASGSITL